MADWNLTGITAAGGECEHCGRRLSRLFRVTSPEGKSMTVGRSCSKNLTGYDWTVKHAETAERDRVAGERWGQLYSDLRTQRGHEAKLFGVSGAAGEGHTALRDGIRGRSDSEVEAYARDMLAKSVARIGKK